jgi:hypothetical protein
MVLVLAAFSLQAEVEKYGAYLGIASFLGLALLSILYFSQARELRRLRDWAGRAPERDQELEARVTAQAESARRVHAQPMPKAAPAPATATATATANQDTQVTAPPLPATAGNGRALEVPMGPRPAVAAARLQAAAAPAAADPEPADATVVVDAPAPAPAPVTPEPDTNGGGDTGEVVIPRATPRPPTPRPPTPRPATPPAQPLRRPTRSATVPPRRIASGRAPAERSGHGRGIMLGALAGVAVLAIVGVLIVTGVLGGDDPSTVPNTTTEPAATATAPDTQSGNATPSKAETTVVILNGTTTDGLAGDAKSALEAGGYSADRMPTDTSTNQTVGQSTVYYAEGRRRIAMDVASLLGIDGVQPLDPDTQVLAENAADTPVEPDVVVILGADRTP